MQRSTPIVNRRRTIRNLTIFTCIVWAIGWIAAAVQARVTDEAAQQLGLLIWLVTPLATVLLLRAFAGDGWKDFGLVPALRGHAFGYAVAVLCHPIGAAAVMLVGYVIGLVAFPDFSAVRLATVFAAGLAPAFVKNVFEEFAWRGYLTPKLQLLGLNDYVGHVVVGLIWAGWHIPYFLYLVDPAALRASTSLSVPVFIAMAIPSLVAVSLVYGELRLLTGSVWPPVIAHAIGNALVDVLIARGFVRVEPGMDLWLSPGYQGVFTIVFFAGAGVALHRWRVARSLETDVKG
jgi:membrane protease YdiL (CAAX protease family)